jgi:hypothetical protein
VREARSDETFPIATGSGRYGDHAGYVDLRLDTRTRDVEAVDDSGEIHGYTDPM